MFETIHRLKVKNEIYEYNAIRSAVRVKGKYKSFMRIYGITRTKDEAILLVKAWEELNPLQYKKRVQYDGETLPVVGIDGCTAIKF